MKEAKDLLADLVDAVETLVWWDQEDNAEVDIHEALEKAKAFLVTKV